VWFGTPNQLTNIIDITIGIVVVDHKAQEDFEVVLGLGVYEGNEANEVFKVLKVHKVFKAYKGQGRMAVKVHKDFKDFKE